MADPFLFDPVKVILTVLVAFIPSIIYAIIIRYSEKYEREAWGSIGQAFLWGGTLGIVVVILIRGFFSFYLEDNFPDLASDEAKRTLIMMALITPIIAELVKPIGLLLVRGDLLEAEDGLIYGSVIGLGFTATENLLFGIYLAPLYGIEIFIAVVFIRSMSVMYIHSSTTALTCYGVTRAMKVKHKTGGFLAFPLFLLAAIGIHALFNYIAFNNLFDIGVLLFNMSSSLLFSIIFAFILMIMIYFKIYRLDRLDEEIEVEAVSGGEMLRAPPRQRAVRSMEAEPYDYYEPEPSPPRRSMPAQRPRTRPQPPPAYDDYYEPPPRAPPRRPTRRPAPYPEYTQPPPRRPAPPARFAHSPRPPRSIPPPPPVPQPITRRRIIQPPPEKVVQSPEPQQPVRKPSPEIRPATKKKPPEPKPQPKKKKSAKKVSEEPKDTVKYEETEDVEVDWDA